ncbi:MAG TPA: SDR family oxidoreductase [candidate division Zixibacteria bacterium]|nr:SDR family oxidoreductase [candidate division Zixibacteria bacterium]
MALNLSENRILITGAAGSLAKQLIYDLSRRGIKPVVHLRETSDSHYADKFNLEKRVMDLRQDTDPTPLVEGIDLVIHTAAWVNFRQDRLTQFTAINTFAAINLYKAAMRAGVKRFVHVSTVGAVGAVRRKDFGKDRERRDFTLVNEQQEYNLDGLRIPYLMTKRAAETELLKLAEDSPTELVIVCPSIIVAPSRTGDDYGKARKMFSRWLIPDLSNRLNLVDIRDVSTGLLAACEKGRHRERYLLAGDNIVIRALLLDVSSLIGKTPHLVRPPRPMLNCLSRWAVIWSKLFGKGKISFYPDIVRMLDYDWAYSSMKARTELGYTNRSIHLTLRDLLNNEMFGTWIKPAR